MNTPFETTNQILFRDIAVNQQIERFGVINEANQLINPDNNENIGKRIQIQQSNMDQIKHIQIIYQTNRFIFQVGKTNIIKQELLRQIQQKRINNLDQQIHNLSYNGRKLSEQELNKSFQDIWPQEKIIELIFSDNSNQQTLQLIVQNQYKVILNQYYEKQNKILNEQVIKKLQKNGKKFYLYINNRVITKNDTFESICQNNLVCKLFIVYYNEIPNQNGKINLSLLQFGEIVTTVQIDPKLEIVKTVNELIGQNCIVYQNGSYLQIPGTARFRIGYKDQTDVCIIIEPQIYYLEQCKEFYQNIINQLNAQIKSLQENNQRNQINNFINQNNAYYFYFQHQQQLLQKIQNTVIKQCSDHINNKISLIKIQEQVGESQIFSDFSTIDQQQLVSLANTQQKASNQEYNFFQQVKYSPSEIKKQCCQCKQNNENDKNSKFIIFDCEHKFHIDCFYEKVKNELIQKLVNPQIKKEIQFSCCEGCQQQIFFRDFQKLLTSFQFNYLQNLQLQHYTKYSSGQSNKKIFICSKCNFATFQYQDKTEISKCLCEPMY